jgi:hypothetical protein
MSNSTMLHLLQKTRILFIVQVVWVILLVFFLAQCSIQQKKERSADELLPAVGFRLVDSPQEIVS